MCRAPLEHSVHTRSICYVRSKTRRQRLRLSFTVTDNASDVANQRMGAITGGLNIPGLF